ncbi:MAG TPA: HAMP domain-containing sensor histidine kinase [Ktedonobacteraceae bacterium]
MQVQREQSQDEVIEALQCQVDELTKANFLLQDQLARKEQYIAMIAHELRGPLTPIISYAQMVARPTQRPETIQRGTKVIISQARRLTRLVNDLLDSSRLSSGRFTLKQEICDIAALANETVEELRPLAPYHTLILEIPEAPVMGNWDCGRLQQALGNLLDNAIKYSDEHTTVTVRIWTEDDMAHVSVHNQGASIPSAEIGQLFRPYVRLQATSARQGSGLGLHITKSIIEAHGGTLRLEPHTEGPGTTFSFDLPLH